MGIMEQAEQAMKEIPAVSADEAIAQRESGHYVFVDVRDIREVEQSDTIDGSQHAPRGMIEFWFDPTSPYYLSLIHI